MTHSYTPAAIRERMNHSSYLRDKVREPDHAADIAHLLSANEALANLLQPFVNGFVSDPGTSDLDNEQPITVRVLLGDWRKARAALAQHRGKTG